MADQRGDLIGSLGGSDNVSVQQSWLADEAAFLRLELAYVRAWLATQSPVNKRRRTAHPILRDYMALVKSLTGVLGQLGLQRRAREVPSLDQYLAARAAAPPASAAAAADAGTHATPVDAAGPVARAAPSVGTPEEPADRAAIGPAAGSRSPGHV